MNNEDLTNAASTVGSIENASATEATLTNSNASLLNANLNLTSTGTLSAPNVRQVTTDTVSGNAGKAGLVVIVKDPNGAEIGRDTTDAQGNFFVDLNPAQKNGELLSVYSTDSTGAVSPTVNKFAPDITPPVEPNSLEVSAEGTQINGKAEPNSQVEILDQQGNRIGVGDTDASGNFSIKVSPAQKNGEQIQLFAKDQKNEVSKTVDFTVPDITAPNAPIASSNPDGSEVYGKGEPNSKIEVKDAQGNVIGTGTVNPDGTFAVKIEPALTDNQNANVTSTDAAGNVSDATPIIGRKDTIAPDITAELNEDGTAVTGQTEPNAKVEVKDENGNVIGTGTAGPDGSYTVNVDPALTDGDKGYVTATDQAGNTSKPAEVVGAKDTTPPAELTAELNAEGTVVTGKTEPNAKVEVKDSNGNVIGTGTANPDGSYTVAVQPAITDGNKGYVTASDEAGNTIGPVEVTGYKDTIPPELTAELNEDGTVVTGKTEPDAKVEVKDADGNVIGTGTAGPDGSYTVNVEPALTDGDKGYVTATDQAGNTSKPVEVIGNKDTTPEPEPDFASYGDIDFVKSTLTQEKTINDVKSGCIVASAKWPSSLNSKTFTISGEQDSKININFKSLEDKSSTNPSNTTFSWQLQKYNAATGKWEDVANATGTQANGETALVKESTVVFEDSVTVNEPGEYRVQFKSEGGAHAYMGEMYDTTVQVETSSWSLESDYTAEGNIFNGEGVETDAQDVIPAGSKLSISTDHGATYTDVDAAGTTIKGKYGDLTISADGSYVYKQTSEGAYADGFVYKVTDANGESKTAILDIVFETTVKGTDTADEFTATTVLNILEMGAGADTVKFTELHDQYGNGDIWTDFSATEGDKIDVQALFSDKDLNTSNIGEFITVEQKGNNTVIKVDLDGQGAQYASTELLVLQNTNTTLDELLKNNNLLY